MPQGSCLGPLLFVIYINDLPLAVRGSTVSMYADDTSLCHQAMNMTQLNEAINNDLAILDTWHQGNKISLNVAKHNLYLLQPNISKTPLKIQIRIWSYSSETMSLMWFKKQNILVFK